MEIYTTVDVVRLSDGAECSVPEHELKENPELYKVRSARGSSGAKTATASGTKPTASKPKPDPKKRGR